ncbi:YybH family protein [Aeoliella mucimassa]|uniref:SnoaL-like domain protein n=1 Tax=Aeoliella mucimassa TaxID=2527972 RepID=A0A518AHM2_9BACT|nr:SgcJ/EcaC family oxidoreductase [Aeoliella mucimassa]QDU54233.1 SnoaL-like domain protein [Aeoliella mucimassa]
MRHLTRLSLVALLFSGAPVLGQTPESDSVAPPAAEAAPSETPTPDAPAADDPTPAIRKVVDSYVAAFNGADAKALAAHWSESGELITSDGAVVKGHDAIEKAFAAYFAENKEAKIEIVDMVVESVSPCVAIESGVARVIAPDSEPEDSEYQVVHVKGPSGWKMDSVREGAPLELPPSHYEQLTSLEWMVGTWSNDSDESTFLSTCRWSTNRNFLIRSFQVVIGDQVDFEGTQVIGWDPHTDTIRSWVFDSDGGFGVGLWSQDGNRWIVQTRHHLPDGRVGTAMNIYELVDDNTVRFESTARQVDGELMPSIDAVELVRQ